MCSVLVSAFSLLDETCGAIPIPFSAPLSFNILFSGNPVAFQGSGDGPLRAGPAHCFPLWSPSCNSLLTGLLPNGLFSSGMNWNLQPILLSFTGSENGDLFCVLWLHFPLCGIPAEAQLVSFP